MKSIDLENAIIALDSLPLLAKLINNSDTVLTQSEMQQALILMEEVVDDKVRKVQEEFYK
jgi:hypothetical protein